MKDHKGGQRGAGRNVIGVRELKTHAAGILRQVREARTSYVVTLRGRAVGVILPVEPTASAMPAPDEASAAWDAFMRAGRRLERRFRPGASGVRLLSDSRR